MQGQVGGGVRGGRTGDGVEQPGVAAALGVHRGVEVVAVAAIPEQAADLGEFVGRGGGVEAQPAGHQGQRERLRLGQPQQFGVRLLEVAQPAQGDGAFEGRAGVAGGLVGVQPQPQFGVELVPLPLLLPRGGRVAYGGQQQGDAGQPGGAAAGPPHASRLGRAQFPYALGEGLTGQLRGGARSGRAQIGVGEDRVPAFGEQGGLGGVLGARQVGHETPASTSEVNSSYRRAKLQGTSRQWTRASHVCDGTDKRRLHFTWRPGDPPQGSPGPLPWKWRLRGSCRRPRRRPRSDRLRGLRRLGGGQAVHERAHREHRAARAGRAVAGG
ncbi:hypothetical protein SALBM217S_00172 [Streptomyces griseoloalbus]